MKKIKIRLIVACVIIASISMTACGNDKKATETLSNNSQSELINTIAQTTQEITDNTVEVVENNQIESDSADINESITNIESIVSVTNETETSLTERDATKIYINGVKLDVSTWKDKTINQILDEIASTGLVYHTIYGTNSSDKLNTEVSVEEVKNAFNDIKENIGVLTIRFGDNVNAHCELLYGTDNEALHITNRNQLILTIKPTTLTNTDFYIADSKYNTEYLDKLTTEEACKQFMEESGLFSKVGEDPVFGFMLKTSSNDGSYELYVGDALGYEFTLNNVKR